MPTNPNNMNTDTNNGNNSLSSNEVDIANFNKNKYYMDKRMDEVNLEAIKAASNKAASEGNLKRTSSLNLSNKYSIGGKPVESDTKNTKLSAEGPYHPLYDLRNFNNFRSTKEQFITDDMQFKLKRTAVLIDNIMLALHHHVLILCQIMIFYSQKI